MTEINASNSLQELASIVSQALVAGGAEATFSGRAAVSIYTNNRYQSQDLDFVSSAAHQTLAAFVRLRFFIGEIVSAGRKLFGWFRVMRLIGRISGAGLLRRNCPNGIDFSLGAV
jgi:hypothetical protein